MKFFQKLGKSLMLPVAVLPIAAILMGVSHWIDPTGETNNAVAVFLMTAGGAIIDHLALLFCLGVSIGMAKQSDGTSALAGLVSWFMVQGLISPKTVAALTNIELEAVNPAFTKTENVFVGILCGIIAATVYNKFKDTKLPDALSFFSGKRCVAIITGGASMLLAGILFFVWPIVYTGLVNFGEAIVGMGAVGAGIYGFFNRLLIPLGLHHALNSVFWFDVAGINDLSNYQTGDGTYGVTGMYMTGFFPVMMFGLAGAALAMYHTSKSKNKKMVAGLMGSAVFAAFLTGITEPLEFAFMFLAPVLYVIHSVLMGISLFVCTILPVRAGFSFSGGMIDLILGAKSPMAENPFLVVPIGIVFFGIYYAIFRFAITKFNLKTPGREDDDELEDSAPVGKSDFATTAQGILDALGGAANIAELDNCVTRLRLEMVDISRIDEAGLKRAGARGVMKPGGNSLQVIIGTQVQFVADAMSGIMSGKLVATSTPAKECSIEITSAVEGELISLSEVPDATFADGLVGEGVAVKPTSDDIVAPFDGTVEMVFETGHAIVLRNAEGVEVLIHIGIDTVQLKGEGFTNIAKEGDIVKMGDPLITVDFKAIEKAGYSTITPIVVANPNDFAVVQPNAKNYGKSVNNSDIIISVVKE